MEELNHDTGTRLVKRGLAEMLKGGGIMDVVDAEQAKIAEDAGATASLEKTSVFTLHSFQNSALHGKWSSGLPVSSS